MRFTAIAVLFIAAFAARAADPITGTWEGALHAGDTSAPITLMLKLDGEKVSGSSVSDHLGNGAVSNGTWKAKKLTFTLSGPHGPMTFTATLTGAKLAGDFDASPGPKGDWEATRK